MFDHEKLYVYQLELKFLTWVTQFLADISRPSQTPTRELRDQLDRASLSALLNTAEGNGRRQGRQRAKSFDDARGSAIECAACLDASVPKDLPFWNEFKPAKKCWSVSWLCLPNWSSDSILTSAGCARMRQA
jgi:four helix bundle protein